MDTLIKHLISTGELSHVIYAVLGVAVVAIFRGITVQIGDKSVSVGKK